MQSTTTDIAALAAPVRATAGTRRIWAFQVATALSFLPMIAQAQSAGGGSITSFLNAITAIIVGPAGIAMCVLALAACGIGIAFHAMRMRDVFITVVGIMIVFASAWIVNSVTGNA